MSTPNKYTPHQNKRECERRLKQFENWCKKWPEEKLKALAELIRKS
jgi:hypothetical protein